MSLRIALWGEESANSCEEPFIPQVKKDLMPKIGQHFENLKEIHEFYNAYARDGGFGIRKSSSKKNKDGEVIRQEFACSKEGFRRPKSDKGKQPTTEPTTEEYEEPVTDSDNENVNQQKPRNRGITRTGCLAKLIVVKDQRVGEGFVVSKFVEGHNHSLLTPKKIHFERSHRGVTQVHRSLTDQLAAANVPTCQQMDILALQYGGLENVGCSQKDLYNANQMRRKSLEGHDANILLEHFENERQKNPGFTFTFETDDAGRMTHCFWADATSRKAFKYFGDVVVFDTTYNTNKYGLIFAPIIGVNHHRQTTLFGCAFLSDERSDTFEWFFNEWLKAMPGTPPKIIITDQDPAMTKAIATVLPQTYHRYCIWHILNKFSEKLGMASYLKHYDAFKDCIWNSRTIGEFEERWPKLLEEANLSSNQWLKHLYDIRDRWIPIYSKDIFAAGMTSSQRAESDHSFFKRYVSKNNSLLEFVTRFDRALGRIRHNELELDTKDVNEKPVLKTSGLMEKKMSEIYTFQIFQKFQEELYQVLAYIGTLKEEDENQYLWEFKRVEHPTSRSRAVLVDKLSNHVSCSCKMFEFEGIPCRHVLAYFTRMYVVELPAEYILRRWTKAAKASRVMDDLGSGVREICDASLLMKRSCLFRLASNVIDDAISNEEDTQILIESLESTQKRIAARKQSREDSEGSVMQASVIQVPTAIASQHSLKDPLPTRAKGCGKRLKGGKEKAVEKVAKRGRYCHGCKKSGQTHDKRNCPAKQLSDDESDDGNESS